MMVAFAVRSAGRRRRLLAVLFGGIAMGVFMAHHAEAQTALPEITVQPAPQPPKNLGQPDQKGTGDTKGNSDARGGDKPSFERLNQQMKRTVDETNPVLNTPPLDASSPDLKTGVVNIPGVQQQYGRNFGHSVVPYRPPPPVYSAPLGHR
jgi:hypothetical protein